MSNATLPMTAGDILHAMDVSVANARDQFATIARDKGEDYAYGVLHGLSCSRAWMRSSDFEKYLERERQKATETKTTTETPK